MEQAEDKIAEIAWTQSTGRGRIWEKLDVLESHLAPLTDLKIPSLLLFTLSRIPPFFLPDAPPPDWVLYALGEVPDRVRIGEEAAHDRAAREASERSVEWDRREERRLARRDLK